MTKKSMVPAKQNPPQTSLARRDFLIKSGALLGTAAFALVDSKLVTAETTSATSLDPNLPLEVPQWTRSLGSPTASPYGKPSTFETNAVRHLYPGLKDTMSAYSTSPLQSWTASLHRTVCSMSATTRAYRKSIRRNTDW